MKENGVFTTKLNKRKKKEIVKYLDQMVPESKEIGDFFEKLASRSVSFEDFIINISFWLEITDGTRNAFFDMILRAAELSTLNIKITHKELTKGENAVISESEKNAFLHKTKDASVRTQIHMTLLKDVISRAIPYQNYAFHEQTPINELLSQSEESVIQQPNPITSVKAKKNPNSNSAKKLERILERYRRQLPRNNANVSENDVKKAVATITSAEKKVKEEKSYGAVRNFFKNLNTIRATYGENLPPPEIIQQMWRIIKMDNDLWRIIHSLDNKDALVINLNQNRDYLLECVRKYFEIKAGNLSDIGELKGLLRQIDESGIKAEVLKSQVTRKINALELAEKTKYPIPDSVRTIMDMILLCDSGMTDLEDYRKTIREESKKKAQSRSCRVSSARITPEQETRMLLMAVSKEIAENPEQYHINNPYDAMVKLEQIGMEEYHAANAVISNLISVGRTSGAESACRKFFEDKKDQKSQGYAREFEQRIRTARVSRFFSKLADKKSIEEVDIQFFESIQSLIREKIINPKDVKLGTSFEGNPILLSDLLNENSGVNR